MGSASVEQTIREPRLTIRDWALQRTTKTPKAVEATGRDDTWTGEGGLS